MAQPRVTTSTSVRSTQRIDASITDAELDQAWAAAESYVEQRCTWPSDGAGNFDPAPPALIQAVGLLTARYLARRNSADGLVGMGDLGAARVPGVDRDVDRLIFPFRKVAIA